MNEREVVNLQEAAEISGYNAEALRRMVVNGKFKSAEKIGNQWFISRKEARLAGIRRKMSKWDWEAIRRGMNGE